MTMIGGLSAATGMVVVDSVALAITISNDLAMPLLLRRRAPAGGRRRRHRRAGAVGPPGSDRRRAGARLCLRAARRARRRWSRSGCSLSPRWRRSRRRFSAGSVAARHSARRDRRHDRRRRSPGSTCCSCPRCGRTELLAAYLAHGPLAIAWLSPEALVAFAPNALVGGVVLSLGANILAFVAFSLRASPTRSNAPRPAPSPR